MGLVSKELVEAYNRVRSGESLSESATASKIGVKWNGVKEVKYDVLQDHGTYSPSGGEIHRILTVYDTDHGNEYFYVLVLDKDLKQLMFAPESIKPTKESMLDWAEKYKSGGVANIPSGKFRDLRHVPVSKNSPFVSSINGKRIPKPIA